MKTLILFFATIIISFGAHAELTPAQYTTLKTDILADPALASQAVAGNYDSIAQNYNAAPAQACTAWKTQVLTDDIMRNGMDWTRVDNLSVGKARIWDWMTRLGAMDCSRANIRAGIDATWVGTAADLAVKAMVYTHCKRTTTRAEKLFSSGACSDASPATLSFEGQLDWSDVRRSLTEF